MSLSVKIVCKGNSASRQSENDKSIWGQSRDYVTKTVRNVCLNKKDLGFVHKNPKIRALHDVLHILHTGRLVTQTVQTVAVYNFTQ